MREGLNVLARMKGSSSNESEIWQRIIGIVYAGEACRAYHLLEPNPVRVPAEGGHFSGAVEIFLGNHRMLRKSTAAPRLAMEAMAYIDIDWSGNRVSNRTTFARTTDRHRNLP